MGAEVHCYLSFTHHFEMCLALFTMPTLRLCVPRAIVAIIGASGSTGAASQWCGPLHSSE